MGNKDIILSKMMSYEIFDGEISVLKCPKLKRGLANRNGGRKRIFSLPPHFICTFSIHAPFGLISRLLKNVQLSYNCMYG